MGKKKKERLSNPADALWKMFEKTGNLSYYLLYKRIKGDGGDFM